jgi:CBS domain-containing membrane protein
MNLQNLRDFLHPLSGNVSHREKLFSGTAAFAGILTVAWISQATAGHQGMVFMAVSMGSAAVVLFAMPHSPMAQPWPLIGGHLVSALVGVLCYKLIPSVSVAAAMAVAVAIVAMFFLRCMNPPGGAAALGAVLGGPLIHDLGFYYALIPVGLNVMVIFIIALIVNNLLPGRRYPLLREQTDEGQKADLTWALGQDVIDDNDLDDVMATIDSYIDVDREDLKQIYQQATLHAYKRRLGHVTCADIMTTDPSVVTADMGLGQVREIMMRQHRVALPYQP